MAKRAGPPDRRPARAAGRSGPGRGTTRIHPLVGALLLVVDSVRRRVTGRTRPSRVRSRHRRRP